MYQPSQLFQAALGHGVYCCNRELRPLLAIEGVTGPPIPRPRLRLCWSFLSPNKWPLYSLLALMSTPSHSRTQGAGVAGPVPSASCVTVGTGGLAKPPEVHCMDSCHQQSSVSSCYLSGSPRPHKLQGHVAMHRPAPPSDSTVLYPCQGASQY